MPTDDEIADALAAASNVDLLVEIVRRQGLDEAEIEELRTRLAELAKPVAAP